MITDIPGAAKEYDPMIMWLLPEQPPEASPVETLRTMLHEIVGTMRERDRTRMIERTRFLLSVPSLRARQWDQMEHNQEMINAVLAERLGRSETDFEIRAFSAAVLGGWTTTIVAWVESGAEGDLLAPLDRGLDYLTAGCPR